MNYKIVVTTASNNHVGTGPLADQNTFDFYNNILGVYKNCTWLHDNIIYFIPNCEEYKDGCFRVGDLLSVSSSEGTISVKVGKFFLIPLQKANVLDEFECSSGEPQKVATIDLKTGNKIP